MSRRLDGDELVVQKPATAFLLPFKKPEHQQHLVVTRSWLADFTPKLLAEFRALAVPVNKARLLGWIVDGSLASKQTDREVPCRKRN